MQVSINVNVLKAAVLSAAKKSVRYYLNGVCFYSKDNVQYIASTDGHRAIRINIADYKIDDCEYIISHDDIKNIIKTGKVFEFSFKEVDGKKLWQANSSVINLSGNCTDGKFPDIARVMPTMTSNDEYAIMNINPDYILDSYKQICLLTSGKLPFGILLKNQSGSAVNSYYYDSAQNSVKHSFINPFTIIVMPLKM